MEEMEPLRQTNFYRALHRPQTVMGGERELTLFSMLIAGGLIVSSMNLVGMTVGVVIWGFCLRQLQKLQKADPSMSQVYLRHLRYNAYYPAHSTPYRIG